ncbi:MAG: leucine-rich repeat domain-containing protein [Treponema sp.]|jgi:hypothetical protein|nr:leucine-rich repeat domain-containing protein [Treponema sp.]
MKKRFLVVQRALVKSALAPAALCVLLALTACDNPAGGSEDPALTGTVSIAGLPRLGETLLAITIALEGDGEISYRWLRGGEPVPGEETAAYALKGADQGELIKVQVHRAGYAGSVESEAVGPVSGDAFTTLAEVSGYLAATPLGVDEANPAYVPVKMELNSENWVGLIAALNATDKLIALDLSACTRGKQSGADGLGPDGKFFGGLQEDNRIVTLILPDKAVTITGLSTANSPFAFFYALKEISGSSVITINANAFRDQNTLVSAHFPEAYSIETFAFRGCSSLAAVYLQSAEQIMANAFSDCGSLATIEIPSVVSISYKAFANCTGLASIYLPASLTSIEITLTTSRDPAFLGCTGLERIEVDNDNPNYSSQGGMLLNKDGSELIAYPSTSGIVTLDEGITRIAEQAFYQQTGITGVIMPGVTNIGSHAFYQCANLETVAAPQAVSTTTPGFSNTGYIFYQCSKLETVSLPALRELLPYAFYGCTSLRTIELPEATAIGNYAFRNCTGLDRISIRKITSIGNYAFAGTGGQSLRIEMGAAPPPAASVGTNPFSGITEAKTVTVSVPNGAGAYYTDSWKDKIKGSATSVTVTIAEETE